MLLKGWYKSLSLENNYSALMLEQSALDYFYIKLAELHSVLFSVLIFQAFWNKLFPLLIKFSLTFKNEHATEVSLLLLGETEAYKWVLGGKNPAPVSLIAPDLSFKPPKCPPPPVNCILAN